MKKPNFAKYDLVAEKNNVGKTSVVVHAPYEKNGEYYMVVCEKLFGRYERFYWLDNEVNANDYVLISRGVIGKIRFMKISKKFILSFLFALLILLVGISFVATYNKLVTENNSIDNSWSQVEVLYQRRYDLIGNLVESVKGSQIQESKVIKDIADGRKQYSNAQSSNNTEAQNNATSSLETTIALLPRLQESYPELKSNEQVSKLITEIQNTEGNIALSRIEYNNKVLAYNNYISRVPKNLYAKLYKFNKRSLYKSVDNASIAPSVKFSN